MVGILGRISLPTTCFLQMKIHQNDPHRLLVLRKDKPLKSPVKASQSIAHLLAALHFRINCFDRKAFLPHGPCILSLPTLSHISNPTAISYVNREVQVE